MSETKWPAGPWHREGNTVYALCDSLDYRDKNGKPIQINRFSAQVQNSNRMASREEVEATAILIQHAPGLYSQLDRVRAALETWISNPEVREELIEEIAILLAKARGEVE